MKLKVDVSIPDGPACNYDKQNPCEFLRQDQCNDYYDCCLFRQRIIETTGEFKKCPICLEHLPKVDK